MPTIVQKYCCLSGLKSLELTWTRRLFKIWRKVERPRQAPPLPECVLCGLLGRWIEREELAFAVCLSLSFYGMLRTGEMLQLTWAQILIGPDDLVLQLGATKTGLRRAIDENVVIRHPITWLLTKTLKDIILRSSARNQTVWPHSAAQFRDRFKALLRFFGLSTSFQPYSLRRGGATADFRAHGSMERTLMRGRWGTSGAARNYVQEGSPHSLSFRSPAARPPFLNITHFFCNDQLVGHDRGRGKPGGFGFK